MSTRLMAQIWSLLNNPFLPPVFFFAGVGYDTLTLTRIDRLQDNLILLLYLVVLGVLIILTGREEFRSGEPEFWESQPGMLRWLGRAQPYYPMAMQFLLGGLFSAYAIFYFRSASLTSSAIFLLLLVGVLVANEFLKDRLTNLSLLITLYALVCLSFFTFFLPVVTGWMNRAVFLAGVGLSAATVYRVVQLIAKDNSAWTRRHSIKTLTPAAAVIGLLVGFYFFNWIPPVPLAMKFGGIYHEVRRAGDRFELTFEKRWFEFLKRSDSDFPAGEPVYCFTAVFAPVNLDTTVYHHWYYRADRGKPYTHADRIPIKISGGREDGYRAYSFKQRLDQGDWRVDVETEDGRVLGRVAVQVKTRPTELSRLATIAY
ncbi:MAG: DUF2914 domain-containing protein [Nitrospiraceae bacterium]